MIVKSYKMVFYSNLKTRTKLVGFTQQQKTPFTANE